MTEVKTPEQLADELGYPSQDADPMIVQGLAKRDPLHDTLRQLVIDAINADRAQRQPELYIVQNDVGDVVDVFRNPDEATEAYQGETCSVIEETVWEPGEWRKANAEH